MIINDGGGNKPRKPKPNKPRVYTGMLPNGTVARGTASQLRRAASKPKKK